MATKWKNDLWSIAAVILALFSLLYCFAFVVEIVTDASAADLLASLRLLPKGGV